MKAHPTKKQEAEEAIEELKQATLAVLDVDDKVDKFKLEQQKARKRLSIARDAVYGLRVN